LKRLAWIGCAAMLSVACAEESTSKERSNATPPATTDAGANEASTTEAGTPDPNDGRDTEPASCYAACANSSFTCGSLVANVTPDSAGCTGTIGPASGTTQTLKLDCGAKEVCIEGTCVDGRYSPTTFAYTPAGGTQIVCTRD
jgi:hypothetical protein